MNNEESAKHYMEWLEHEVSAATQAAAWPLVERLVRNENSTVPVDSLLADAREKVKAIDNPDVAEFVLKDPIFDQLAEKIQELA